MARADFLTTPRQLHEHLQDWRIVDCRFDLADPDKGRCDYLAGHLPGAVYAHLDHDLAAPVTDRTGRHPLPDPAEFAVTLGHWGITIDRHVVVYDQGGGAIAARLWWMLRWMGHRSVRLLDGGFAGWLRQGLPVSRVVGQPQPVIFEGVPDNRMIVTTAEIERAVADGAPLTLVDARDPARFAGLREPIDPVAGHVPQARNFPFDTSLEDDATWRPDAELAAAWSGTLADDERNSGSFAVMCGSGVTACHLALSAGLAGVPAPRLYVGSWSEWIRDPGRPVAPAPAPPPAAEGG